MSRRAPLVFFLTLVTAATVGAQQHPFNVHDLVAMQRVSDPQPSPDGSRAAFVVTTMDLEANAGSKDIWLAATDGSGASPLITDPADDWSPRWRDGGALYFLSTRSGSAQAWRLDLASGGAQQVTDLPLDLETLAVGPGGRSLYVGIKVFPDCEVSIPCTVDKLAKRDATKASGMIFNKVFVRHWDTWEDGRRNHIFRIPIGDDGSAGPPLDLMAGVDGNCPTMPWGGDGDYTVSPDDAWLVYSAKVVEGSEQVWSTDWDLWAVPTDGSQPPRCLTEDNEAWDAAPVFSPDGRSLAYLAMTRLW